MTSVVSLSFTGTYFWFHEGEHQGFGRRRQQAGVWVQNQGDCLMARGEGWGVEGGRKRERSDLMDSSHKLQHDLRE